MIQHRVGIYCISVQDYSNSVSQCSIRHDLHLYTDSNVYRTSFVLVYDYNNIIIKQTSHPEQYGFEMSNNCFIITW